MPWNPVLHTHTPVLAVIEPRGLLARSVSFHRAETTETLTERIDRTAYDAAARPVGRWDARLWAAAEQASAAPRNLSYIHSLSGRPLFSDSADAGWSASLEGEAGQAVYHWNARGHSQRTEHDPLLRAVAVFEGDGTVEHCAERLTYGGPGAADSNQCGCLVRHDDPAGSLVNAAFGLSGKPARQVRRFLNGLATADWPAAVSERDELLESGPGLQTCWTYGAANDAVEQCDALGSIQSFSQSVAGQLKLVQLQQSGQAVQTIVSDIRYNAQGRIESETAGNGVVTTALYQPQDGRLIRLKAQRDDGHVLQDLHYEYDPVGNVTRLEDGAQATRFSTNQQIEPVSTYRYDTLYQLIEATGRETASTHHGPALPGFQSPADFSKLTNYRQTYEYDAGGNLLKLSHEGAQNHSLNMVIARHSNRSLPVLNDVPPSEADIAAAFDGNGNLRELQPGQTLTWDRRNQLQQVRPVIRESGPDDSESYVYDGSGRRVRKVTKTLARSVTHTAEVRYLPGVEIRSNTATGETLHVVSVQGGRNSVRVLHWQQGKPEGIGNDQIRYGLSDHLGSCALELDQQAQTISHESYYPFGGTSWWAGRSEVEARYKTVRYSGKERDATGLYYYGLRYYAPWLMRWINPDPAGDVDGLNVFRWIKSNPVSGFDDSGLMFKWFNEILDPDERKIRNLGFEIKIRGADEAMREGKSHLIFKLDMALIEGQALIQREIDLLAKGETAALTKFLGAQPQMDGLDERVKSVIQGYTKISEAMGRYKHGGDLRQSLILIEPSSTNPLDINTVAMVSPGDTKKRLFLNSRFQEKSIVEMISTVVHEVSHQELETDDLFYYAPLEISLSKGKERFSTSLANGAQSAEIYNLAARNNQHHLQHGFGNTEDFIMRTADFWGRYLISRRLSADTQNRLLSYSTANPRAAVSS
ncbi:RHS repeat-associated core domain-containing protein [Xanthomonas sp. WHRI 1810A]|uniref:RHS repeat domain-containing protein n=1 Tax=Xanthomonas sp. WHRI 1810A TaxID=3161565 RepID=UPI0032E8F4DE